MTEGYLLDIFDLQTDYLHFSAWLPAVTEAEFRRTFSIPPEVWHGLGVFEVETPEQRAWLGSVAPDLVIDWDRYAAFLSLADLATGLPLRMPGVEGRLGDITWIKRVDRDTCLEVTVPGREMLHVDYQDEDTARKFLESEGLAEDLIGAILL